MPDEIPVPRACPAALAALGVPAKRWLTRIDIFHQLQTAKTYLETAPPDEASICQAAEEAGMSLHHFIRNFHELYGITPHQFLSRRRIEEAQKLLEREELSVTEVALEVGYKDLSAFGREFKSVVGQSPRAYRKDKRAISAE